MKVLGLDFEITGLSPENDRITEVGAVLWDWNLSAPVCLLSSFVDPQRAIPAEITALTGITDQLIEDYARTEEDVFADLDYLISRADCVMAHNGTTFDKPFCVAAYSRVGRVIPNKPWLDTRTDIKYPEHITTRNLRHLASEHSFLNPFAHRAVFDVLTMLKVASHYDIQAIVSRASEPTVYVQALVSFDDRDKAKARGYLWCGPKRIWWRGFKQSEYAAEKGSCGFQTTVLPGSPE